MRSNLAVCTDFEVWPGPMEGVGSNEFAAAAAALHLTGCWMTPFIRITDTVPSVSRIFKRMERYLTGNLPVIFQLMGNEASGLIDCARKILEHPAVFGINLNMGCPSSRVVRHGAGGGLLKNPGKAVDLALEVANALPSGVFSVKIRSGFADASDMKELLEPLCRSGKVAKVFFHYRTVLENYSSDVLPFREERIAGAVKLCGKVPLIANGDIDSVETAVKLVERTAAAGVMIARPWMKDPFLLRRFYTDAPDAESGRELFFAKLKENGVRGGALIEMARMLWGSKSQRFRDIISRELV